MRVLIMGGDGYLGWPTAMSFAAKGHDVCVIDNYLRRNIAQQTQSEGLMPNPNLHDRADLFKAHLGKDIRVEIGDVADYRTLSRVFEETQPEVVIHYAEQPSAPYSMMGFDQASQTLNNNLNATMNLIWAVMEYNPDCHIVKLGTMGEYGTPNIDIEEGWIDIEHKGRSGKFLFPRAAGSLYHTTKVLDTDLLWFYVRTFNLRVTDLMQGPVYGLDTPESDMDEGLLPNFHYDDIFGTAVNRFLVQAVAGIPLTVYGKADQGELRILNQFTETFSVNALAEQVQRVGNQMDLNVEVKSIENPRKEAEDHYYNPAHSGLMDLGLQPHYMTDDVVASMLERIVQYRDQIDKKKILPRVRWK